MVLAFMKGHYSGCGRGVEANDISVGLNIRTAKANKILSDLVKLEKLAVKNGLLIPSDKPIRFQIEPVNMPSHTVVYDYR